MNAIEKKKEIIKNPKVVFGVIMGTGVGGGIIVDGKSIFGLNPLGWDEFLYFFPGYVFCHAVCGGTVEICFTWAIYCCFE